MTTSRATTLVVVVALLLQARMPYAHAQCTLINKPPFSAFTTYTTTSPYNLQGLLPPKGSCNTWAMLLNLTSGSPCNQTDSWLVLDLWLTEKKNGMDVVIDPERTISGVYLMSNSKQPPTVTITSSGGLVFNPALPFGNNPSPIGTYIDAEGISNLRPVQRVAIPIGALQDFYTINSTWYMTLANMQGASTNISYSIRATCMPASAMPCPRPAQNATPCNSQGTCTATDPTSLGSCNCNATYGDPACGTSVTDLTSSNGVIIPVDVPVTAWRYFTVTIPPTGDAKLLVELTKPPGSANTYQPLLLLSSSGLPGYADIDPATLYQPDSCSCNSCRCVMPDLAQNLNYKIARMQGTDSPTVWYIGVYNNLQALGAGLPSDPLTLSVRWTSSSLVAAPLCPADCSNNGVCSNPPLSISSGQQPLPSYSCDCTTGFGGPYCQGALQTVVLSSANMGFSDTQQLVAGQWTYYFLTTASSGTVTWSEMSPSSPLYFIVSPMYNSSIGENYFMPINSMLYSSSTGVRVPGITGQPGDAIGFIIGILNSDTSIAVTSSFNINMALPDHTTLNFLSTLQMALIAAVSGLIVALLVFMAVRLLLMRRAMARLSPEELALGDMPGRPARSVLPGVPAAIVATFPVFKYEAATFATLKTRKSLPRGKATLPPGDELPPDGDLIASVPAQVQPASLPRGPSKDGKAAEEAEGKVVAVKASKDASLSSGHGDGNGSSGEDEDSDAPQCSVCICDYEEGELLRRLPCMHVFHQSCIDTWMVQHNTCPNCRQPLCPDAVDERRQGRGRPPRNQVIPVYYLGHGQDGEAVTVQQSSRTAESASESPAGVSTDASHNSEPGANQILQLQHSTAAPEASSVLPEAQLVAIGRPAGSDTPTSRPASQVLELRPMRRGPASSPRPSGSVPSSPPLPQVIP